MFVSCFLQKSAPCQAYSINTYCINEMWCSVSVHCLHVVRLGNRKFAFLATEVGVLLTAAPHISPCPAGSLSAVLTEVLLCRYIQLILIPFLNQCDEGKLQLPAGGYGSSCAIIPRTCLSPGEPIPTPLPPYLASAALLSLHAWTSNLVTNVALYFSEPKALLAGGKTPLSRSYQPLLHKLRAFSFFPISISKFLHLLPTALTYSVNLSGSLDISGEGRGEFTSPFLYPGLRMTNALWS